MTPKQRATASLGAPKHAAAPPAESMELDESLLEKPVSDMDDGEKAAARKKILDALAARAALGNKDLFECVIDSEEYQGVIKFKRPSNDENRRIGIRTAQYLGGQVGVDVKTENLAIFFATFEICVLWPEAPEWFKPREMPSSDYALLEFAYRGFAEWLDTFRKFVPRERLADSEAPAV